MAVSRRTCHGSCELEASGDTGPQFATVIIAGETAIPAVITAGEAAMMKLPWLL